MTRAEVLSIQVGRPREYGEQGARHPMDRPWRSAIAKQPVEHPVWLDRINIEGDDQADRQGHGGPEKAVMAYAAAHYEAWRSELDRPRLPFGAFGENLTVAGLTEQSVCIGDTWQLGGATVQVSQPRVPCFKLAYRWRIKDLTARVLKTGRTGWYLRVLNEGEIQAGQEMTLLDRPYPQWTVARATEAERRRRSDHAAALELASCPLLNVAWREWLVAEVDAASATQVARHA